MCGASVVLVIKAWRPEFGSLAPMSNPGMVAHAGNHNIREAETGGSLEPAGRLA